MTGRGDRVTDAAGGPARHVPVLLRGVLETLSVRAGGAYCDGTFGAGGYTRAILAAAQDARVVAIDRDPAAIAGGAALVADSGGRLTLVEGRFGDLDSIAAEAGFGALDGVVLDIGVSSMQLDEAARGFSFRQGRPARHAHGARTARTAADWSTRLRGNAGATSRTHYGEERASRRIARAIVAARTAAPISSTLRARRDRVALSAARQARTDPSGDAQLPGAPYRRERRTRRARRRA